MLHLRLFRYTMVTCGLILLVGGALVGIRLAPLHLRSGVAWGTLWPLFASALAAVFETALVIGVPIGCSLALGAAARERSIKSAGSSAEVPSTSRAWIGIAVLWLVTTAGIGAYANLRLTTPGRVARGVVQGARELCDESQGKGSVPVPIIGARWVCAPPTPPRLVGELSKYGLVTRYSARDIEVSEDLAYVDLTEFDLSSPGLRGRPSLHLAVQGARLRGAWPWAKPKRMSDIGRAVFVASLASLLGLFVALLMRNRFIGSRWAGPVVAAIGGLGAWILLGYVDTRLNWSTAGYGAVPLGAGLTMLATSKLLGHLGLRRSMLAAALGWQHLRRLFVRKPR